MTKGERIALIRKENGLSQQKFADKLLVSRNFIAQAETDKKDISIRMVQSICEKFGVNESWLLTGTGEMICPKTREQEIATITAAMYEQDPDSFEYKFMTRLAKLNKDEWKVLKSIIEDLAN